MNFKYTIVYSRKGNDMASVLRVGQKIEMETIVPNDNGEKFTYLSQLEDIFPNGEIEIDMPISGGRLILLSVGSRYEMVFTSEGISYKTVGKIKDRYKSDNRFLLRVEILAPLEKYQRREFYRCDCYLEIKYQDLILDETVTEDGKKYYDYRINPDKSEIFHGVMLDISGGGLRFVSRKQSKSGDYKRFIFALGQDDYKREYNLIGKIVSSYPIKDSKTKFENRVQFIDLSKRDQEGIIKFIFEEERKQRKLMRGNRE